MHIIEFVTNTRDELNLFAEYWLSSPVATHPASMEDWEWLEQFKSWLAGRDKGGE